MAAVEPAVPPRAAAAAAALRASSAAAGSAADAAVEPAIPVELDDAFTGLACEQVCSATTQHGGLLSTRALEGLPLPLPLPVPLSLDSLITTIHPAVRHSPRKQGLMTVAGFGSLLSETSARSTFPQLRDFRQGRLRGWRRVFAHQVGVGLAGRRE